MDLTADNSKGLWVAPVERTASGLRFGEVISIPATRTWLPSFSPDNRFLTYMSGESGRFQIFVISLTADGRPAGGKWLISPE